MGHTHPSIRLPFGLFLPVLRRLSDLPTARPVAAATPLATRLVCLSALAVLASACVAERPPAAAPAQQTQQLPGPDVNKPPGDAAAGSPDAGDAAALDVASAADSAEVADAVAAEAVDVADAATADASTADASTAELTVRDTVDPLEAGDDSAEGAEADAAVEDGAAEVGTDPDADATAADVDAADGSTADGSDAIDAWIAPIGGQPDSGCPGQDGAVACSPDGKYRVECTNGAWTAVQHCGFGACTAQKTPGGAVLTKCAVLATKNTDASAACALYSKCFGGPSHETCVRGVLATSAVVGGLPVGKPIAVVDVAFTGIASNLACAAAATTCQALAECLYFFNPPKCLAASAGCSGDVAWQCTGSAALAVSCKAVGMNCLSNGSTAQCIAAQPCPSPAPVTCADGIASKCSNQIDGKPWLEKLDCAAAAGSCQSGATSLAAGCAGPPETPCKVKEFSVYCKDNVAHMCAGGDTVKTVCGPGLSCVVENQFAIFVKQCPEGEGCTLATCSEGGACSAKSKCNGSEVWFCEAKQPVAYDCKAKGMGCVTGAQGPRCQ